MIAKLCVRCGRYEGVSDFCRDDHDHIFRPIAHPLNRKWTGGAEGVPPRKEREEK